MPAPKKPPPQVRERLCGNCLFFLPEEESPDVGECRNRPPVVLYDTEQGAFSAYPMVDASKDWCGQHQGNQ